MTIPTGQIFVIGDSHIGLSPGSEQPINAWLDRLAELRAVDSHEVDQLAAVREAEGFNGENARGLRECLGAERAGR